MPAAITGLRGSGQFSTDFRPTNYRELYTMLEPNGSAPLQALLSMAGSQDTDDAKFNVFRDELPDRYVTINNGAGYNSSATSLVVDAGNDVAYIVNGTTLYNVSTGELMQATADCSGTTLTVTRNIGGTSYTITDNDVIIVAGHAAQEGGTSPTALSFDPTTDYNYTQIFKTAVEVSGTLQKTYLRTGSKEDESLMKALKLHMADIERAMFFGRRTEVNGSTANPTRYTGGLLSTITNVVDAASGFTAANKITEKEFDRLLVETLFAWGSKQKVMFAGPRVVSNMMEIGKNRWTPHQIDNAYGVSFTRYTTFAGDLLVYMHPMFRQVPGMQYTGVILDLAQVKYRYLQGRDTQLQRNIQANDKDGAKHQYLTECGLELTQAKPHYVLKNWQGLS